MIARLLGLDSVWPFGYMELHARLLRIQQINLHTLHFLGQTIGDAHPVVAQAVQIWAEYGGRDGEAFQ